LLEAIMEVVNLTSEDAPDLIELETGLLNGGTNRGYVFGVLCEKQCSSRLRWKGRAFREKTSVNGI
jgi:hypothetical protein